MNLLIVGSGGREHALGWKIKQSPKINKLFFAPGNAGELKKQAQQLGLDVKTEVFIGNEVSGILDECREYNPDLLVMGLHKKGFFSRLLGENPELALVKHAPCRLLLIPE